jgi:hypothetical protein
VNDRDLDLRIESATTAHRPLDHRGMLRASPAWHDLTPDQRIELDRRIELQRLLEAAADGQGLSSTARLVLSRVTGR